MILVTHKGKLLKDTDLIKGKIEAGDIIDVQIKINPSRSLEYVTHDKQNVLDLMYTVYCNTIQEDEEIKMSEIIKELKDLSESQTGFKEVEDLLTFADVIGMVDLKLSQEELLLRALIKTYTSEACYRQISQSIVNGMQERCANYLTKLLTQLPKVGSKFAYRETHVPLYRGILRQYVNLEDYKACRVHYWAAFSSSSKSKQVAISMSRRGKPQNEKAVIFEIYVSHHNEPYTNIELPATWSFYPAE